MNKIAHDVKAHRMTTVLKLAAVSAAAAVAYTWAGPAQAVGLIVNGGFESGFSGWTRADQAGSDGTFLLQTGSTSPVSGLPVPLPPEGRAAMTDGGTGGSHVLYQDFTVPLGIGSGTVGFSLFINSGDTFRNPASLDWAATSQPGSPILNQQARVDILTAASDPFSAASGDVLLNVFQTQPTDATVYGYSSSSTDISSLLLAHQGQTLRLRFAEVNNVSFFNLGVDQVDVQVFPLVVPEPSSTALLTVGLACLAGLGVRRRLAARPRSA